jgi:ribosome-binding factor A
MEQIKEKVEKGVLTEDEAREYRHYFKTRLDKAIKLNLMPKVFFEQNNSIDNRMLLKNLEGLKLLNAPEENN